MSLTLLLTLTILSVTMTTPHTVSFRGCGAPRLFSPPFACAKSSCCTSSVQDTLEADDLGRRAFSHAGSRSRLGAAAWSSHRHHWHRPPEPKVLRAMTLRTACSLRRASSWWPADGGCEPELTMSLPAPGVRLSEDLRSYTCSSGRLSRQAENQAQGRP